MPQTSGNTAAQPCGARARMPRKPAWLLALSSRPSSIVAAIGRLAMQKVEGSSPFIRFVFEPAAASGSVAWPRICHQTWFSSARGMPLRVIAIGFWLGLNSRLRDAEVAVHEGDAGPRREIWSRKEPVTVLGALKSATGRPQVDELFTWMAGTFSGCTSFGLEIVAAEVTGDIAYTVAYEHTEQQSSTASPASIPSEQRRSTGARMASGRLFIATEVRYRNACHDWRLRASEPLQQLRSGR